jgi:uncharacterized membrane protein YfcA
MPEAGLEASMPQTLPQPSFQDIEDDDAEFFDEDAMFAYHKDLWPLNSMDLFCMLFSAIALIVAAGGGIGGGGILVPMYMIFLRFRPKHAIALSNFTILGGAITNTWFNVQNSDFPDRGGAVIDWNIIVMMEPSTIAGAVIGSFLSKFLPDFILSLSLTVVLGIFSFRTLEKGIRLYQKESEREANQGRTRNMYEDDGETEADENAALVGRSEEDEPADLPSDEEVTPWGKIGLLVWCFAGCVVLTILKGSGHGSIIGVECGSIGFWALSLASIPWVGIFGIIFRRMLIVENNQKVKSGHRFDSTDIRWDAKTTIRYPLICTLAGILAGLLGVGGGIVKGPLMLEMGVSPRVAAASAATMILFTTSAACVSFQVFGLLEPHYGTMCFLLGLGCTAIGQGIMNSWMKAAKRQSPPVLSIGLVMAISTVLVSFEAFDKFSGQDWSVLFQPSAICSRVS